MKKCIIVILVIVLIIILGLGTLYAIDMYRMDNNLPVVFSTWGYNYAPPIKPINSGESNSGEVQIGSIKTKLEDLPKDLSNFEEEHVFINVFGKISNKFLLDNFLNDVDNNIDSNVRIVSTTIEGDPIIKDVYFINGVFEIYYDATRDNFGLSTEITKNTYSSSEYHYLINTSQDRNDLTEIKLVKQVLSSGEHESSPLTIEDEVYICSYTSVNEDSNKNSFIGTIIEENESYLIVEPNEDEFERKSSDRIMVPLKDINRDYIYGEGRKVLIEFTGDIKETYPAQIDNATISFNGYSDFEILVVNGENVLSSRRGLKDIDSFEADRFLWITGFEAVDVKIGEDIFDFNEALESGKITANGLISKANKDNESGLNEKVTFKDGGSTIWRYDDFAILKMNTVDGDNDILIGPKDINKETLENLRKVYNDGGAKMLEQ